MQLRVVRHRHCEHRRHVLSVRRVTQAAAKHLPERLGAQGFGSASSNVATFQNKCSTQQALWQLWLYNRHCPVRSKYTLATPSRESQLFSNCSAQVQYTKHTLAAPAPSVVHEVHSLWQLRLNSCTLHYTCCIVEYTMYILSALVVSTNVVRRVRKVQFGTSRASGMMANELAIGWAPFKLQSPHVDLRQLAHHVCSPQHRFAAFRACN